MNAIKKAIVIMGVLIIVGVIFLSYVLYQRITGVGHFAKSHTDTLQTELSTLTQAVQASRPAAVALHLGNDAQVVAIHDFNNRVLLLIRQPKVGDRLYLVDPRTGAVASAVGIGDSVPPVPEAAPVSPPAASAPAVPVPAVPTPAAPAAATGQTQLVPATKPSAPGSQPAIVPATKPSTR